MIDFDYRKKIIELYNRLNDLESSQIEENRYMVYGFSIMINRIAISLNDKEVIKISALLTSKAQKSIEQVYESYQDTTFTKIYDRKQEVKKICIEIFFTNKEFTVDMSKYKKAIEENKNSLNLSNRYDRLCRYIDEDKVIYKISNSRLLKINTKNHKLSSVTL